MQRHEWNALETGDRVTVHDDDDPALTLHTGTVVSATRAAGAANIVGVRLDDRPDHVVLPRRNAVHHLPLVADRSCWRCNPTN